MKEKNTAKNKEEKSKSLKKGEKDTKKKETAKQLTFDSPSDKLIHQILPYVFAVLALLLETCFVLASINGDMYVGMAGVFLKNVFVGLFGVCAFILPLSLIYLALSWRKFIDMGVVGTKTIFTILFLLSLSGLIHIYIKPIVNPDLGVLILPPELVQYSMNNPLSSGVIGGFLCECVYALFKSVGSTIIFAALTIIFLIFSLGMTPRNIAIFFRYKWTLRKERAAERKEEKREQRREAKELKKLRKEEEEKAFVEARAKLEAEKQARIEAEREAEEKRIAAAERRAMEIEAKEKEEKANEPIFIIPENDEYREPSQGKIDLDSKNKGIINVGEIFKNPPKEYDAKSAPIEIEVEEEKPKSKKKPEIMELEVKEITDMETVPDDGEDSEAMADDAKYEYVRPPIELLKEYKEDRDEQAAHDEVMTNARTLMDTLKSFNVRIKEITYSRGPTITRFELTPDDGVRIRSIQNLLADIQIKLSTPDVRLEPYIPGKQAVGIEVPNKIASTVSLRSLIGSTEFAEKKSILTASLGKDVGGNPIFFDIGKMPHMLIAGTTGSGKSVCINCIIMSILYKASPRDVKLILIDPKKVEFQPYRSIPHLYAPIVTEPKKAAGALASAVAEMERRFELIESVGAKNIAGYNELTANDTTKEFLPYIVIVIDELADLMMTAADDVETAICRIAQKARAAGIHLIVGTQRPSVDVVTGLIKANIPSRIAFTVASQVDSKTILDNAGAEKLIGRGDMLFAPIGMTKPMRVQGAFIDDREVEEIVDYISEHNDGVHFNDAFIKRIEEEAAKCGNKKGSGSSVSYDDDEGPGEEGVDPKFKAALDVAIEMGKISTSLLQRRLEIGYGRAAKIIDRMEALGYVSAPDGNKPRVCLVSKAEIMEKRLNED